MFAKPDVKREKHFENKIHMVNQNHHSLIKTSLQDFLNVKNYNWTSVTSVPLFQDIVNENTLHNGAKNKMLSIESVFNFTKPKMHDSEIKKL